VLTFIRILGAAVAVLIMFGGLVALTAGQAPAGLWAMVLGAAGLVGLGFERMRYRSEATERTRADAGAGGGEPHVPQHPFRPTDERFVDPTTGRLMRVYLDPATGERRYHAEG
jgi:hypothetical protein